MNKLLILIASLALASCSQHNNDAQIATLQKRVDSLQKVQSDIYRPGLGEFMAGIQLHHAKLWCAGKEGNWPLADFELGEITESIEDIKKYETDRKEVKTIDMINPALGGLANAVKQKNAEAFKTNFILLTGACNSCHQINNFGFNVIKVPDAVPVPNQVFTPAK
jgi:hypothetical protein